MAWSPYRCNDRCDIDISQDQNVKIFNVSVLKHRRKHVLRWLQLYGDQVRLGLVDRNGIVKSCDSSSFWLIVERLITVENNNLTEIGSNLQPQRFLL